MSEVRTIETVADALKFLKDYEKRFFASNREIARLEKRNAALEQVARGLRDALSRIDKWEMPDSGRSWDDGTPMSYAAAFGSNGERQVIRSIAKDALAAADVLEEK